MNTFDKLITSALFAIAIASAFVANGAMNELNAIQDNQGKGRALATESVAKK